MNKDIIIQQLQAELKEKDIIFHQLQDELKQKDASFEQLQTELKELRYIVMQQAKKIDEQTLQITKQAEQITKQKSEIRVLKKQLNKNSNNSSKPPSSDGLKKKPRTQSLRKNGQNQSGGQKGHKGKTLHQVSNPDHTNRHNLTTCPNCSSSLKNVHVDRLNKRQVFDIAMPKLEVTEHQTEAKKCPCCCEMVTSSFPKDVQAPVQYGPNIQSFAQYFHHGQLIPEDRLQEVFLDIFGIQIATATLTSFSKKLSTKLEPFNQAVLDKICTAIKKHLDETGFRIGGKTNWLHVASNEDLTYYHFSKKRKSLLDGLTGLVVHDHWKPYYKLENVIHALCNAHHLRELKALIEDNELWAHQMWRFLLFALKYRKAYPNTPIPSDKLCRLVKLYNRIIDIGLRFHNGLPPPSSVGIRGRKKRHPGHNLLLRLQRYQEDVLRFLKDHRSSFTNNQAERDIRMMKCKQKISGGFRTNEGAQQFVSIRGFISTARKQGWNIFKALSRAIAGNVPMPA